MSTARDEILARIRGALGPGRAVIEVPREAPEVAGDPAELVERFSGRVADYRSSVVVVPPAGVAEAIAAACARRGVARLGVPDGFDADWLGAGFLPPGVEVVPARPGTRDDALAFTQLDALVARAPLAVAETGTIIFDGGPGQGPRAASLLPDLLIAVVPAEVIVGGVAEATTRMGAVVRETARPLTLVSGPSATSDIELDRVEGVHGPRTLEVIVVSTPAAGA